MPEIKLQHVVSCSSEDKGYPAENLLLGDGFKKWKGAKTGEKHISVTFQLEKATKIEKIDIGNEGSAFVEILVGKSSGGDDFQVLLVASAFMSPLDSRAAKNMTSVRMFSGEKLSKNIAEQKWDRIKVVCTQPFNKTIQYGLAFIKFHSPPDPGSTSTPATTKIQTTLGGFKLKDEAGDGIKTGTLFSHRDQQRPTPSPLTGAAAVRAASKLAEEASMAAPATPDTQKPKTLKHTATPTTTDTPTSSRDTPRDTSQVKRKHEGESSSSSKRKSVDSRSQSDTHHTPLRKQQTTSSVGSTSSKKDSHKPTQLKKTKSEPGKAAKDVAFDSLMKGVVFVMSGYQNPERGNIRDKAIEMGATYKGDWGNGCTHLICAFENTPKYNQVKGKGRIVDRKWITDSYKAKKQLPWKSYRVGRARSPAGGSSDGSDDDDVPITPTLSTQSSISSISTTTSSYKRQESDLSFVVADSDMDSANGSSGDDTEDEIRRVRDSEKKKTPKKQIPRKEVPKKSPVTNQDIYDASTDEEMDTGTTNGVAMTTGAVEIDGLPELPNIFSGKKFFFYGNFDTLEKRKMLRFVIAYNGHVADYMTGAVTYVLTKSDWDDNFDQALSDNPGLSFIRPDWLYACDAQQKYIPYQRYSVIPK